MPSSLIANLRVPVAPTPDVMAGKADAQNRAGGPLSEFALKNGRSSACCPPV